MNVVERIIEHAHIHDDPENMGHINHVVFEYYFVEHIFICNTYRSIFSLYYFIFISFPCVSF